MYRLLRQHLKDWVKAKRYGYLPPALWETRAWLRAVDRNRRP
jgi:hypothetical protein